MPLDTNLLDDERKTECLWSRIRVTQVPQEEGTCNLRVTVWAPLSIQNLNSFGVKIARTTFPVRGSIRDQLPKKRDRGM